MAPQSGAPQSGGSSFLRSAMTTAAGVAGGALLFEGIRSLMGSHPGPFGSAAAAAQPSPLLPPDSLPAAPSQDRAMADDGAVGQDDQVEDYDTASDMDVGGSDDDSLA